MALQIKENTPILYTSLSWFHLFLLYYMNNPLMDTPEKKILTFNVNHRLPCQQRLILPSACPHTPPIVESCSTWRFLCSSDIYMLCLSCPQGLLRLLAVSSSPPTLAGWKDFSVFGSWPFSSTGNRHLTI